YPTNRYQSHNHCYQHAITSSFLISISPNSAFSPWIHDGTHPLLWHLKTLLPNLGQKVFTAHWV
ncbi:hypothetical protein, partial [Yersinia pestis]|uniref:hypothetical protein n=1 Tax=Yersinia pestis TaxID=632 RepID=UPI001ED9C35B